jgi:hypothetical protein
LLREEAEGGGISWNEIAHQRTDLLLMHVGRSCSGFPLAQERIDQST